ncbi:MAG: T9SS type A sorting domain-containing protein, partial [Candidatus Delongbacteria bacterium]|nr:T9SS type A sorting domain-containing protein [Candidatus Delongbacteria bacterium]MCG2760227.1 T9SS type A sorting domain-containing protein [Candidatus Delongbacteria bacterium]
IFINVDIPDSAVVDGFTISHAYEDITNMHGLYTRGAAMHNEETSLMISNCVFSNNYTYKSGGAVHNTAGPDYITFNMKFDNCFFFNNSAVSSGGAVSGSNSFILIFRDCSFINNTSEGTSVVDTYGGPDYILSEFYNCLIYGNHSETGACMCLSRSNGFSPTDKSLKIINCTFAKNTSITGTGGIDLFNLTDLEHYAELTNSVFYLNDSDDIYIADELALPDINNCAVEGGISIPFYGEANINLSPNNSGDPNSPYFSDPDNDYWWIQEHSPLRNAGIWTNDVPLYDLAGFTRDAIPDIGCYEYDPTSIEESDNILPLTTELFQNYPNPFNPVTNIKFDLSKTGKVELSVYNIAGQLVKKLVDKKMPAGYHSVRFVANDLNSGLYYYTLKTSDKKLTRKMLMVK